MGLLSSQRWLWEVRGQPAQGMDTEQVARAAASGPAIVLFRSPEAGCSVLAAVPGSAPACADPGAAGGGDPPLPTFSSASGMSITRAWGAHHYACGQQGNGGALGWSGTLARCQLRWYPLALRLPGATSLNLALCTSMTTP